MKQPLVRGHLSAILTIFIWALTYVSTKVLLEDLSAIDILIVRILLAYLALCVIYPKPIKPTDKKQEIYFALSGLTGVALYFLLQNIGLNLTTASNASVILSTAPFFTAVFGALILKEKNQLSTRFFIGFAIALTGIALISFNGEAASVHLLGDLLSLLSAAIWGVYSLLSGKAASFGYSNLMATRRIFFYGIIFLSPLIVYDGFHISYSALLQPVNLLNLLFLSLGASALCFLTWNYAVKTIGAVKTSVYIYFEPVVTVISSLWILGEKLTVSTAAGIVLAIVGLIISQYERKQR